MYHIDIQSIEDYSCHNPFQTKVRIIPIKHENIRIIRAAVQWNANYLIVYHNPILRLFNFSPLLVYMGKSSASEAIINEIITIDEEMIFSFKKVSTRKHFERKVMPVLVKFIDKKIKFILENKNEPIASFLNNEQYKGIKS